MHLPRSCISLTQRHDVNRILCKSHASGRASRRLLLAPLFSNAEPVENGTRKDTPCKEACVHPAPKGPRNLCPIMGIFLIMGRANPRHAPIAVISGGRLHEIHLA